MGISRERMEEIRKETDKIKQAANDISQGILTLWKSRLDMAIAHEDEEVIQQLLNQTSQMMMKPYMDTNCGCGGNGGTHFW